MKIKRGRPRKPKSEKRLRRQLSLTDEEWRKLQACARYKKMTASRVVGYWALRWAEVNEVS